MKRILVVAVLAGAVAASAAAARAQGPMGDAAPQQAAPQQTVPADANVVQPEASRGALGGLASGAPSVAQNVQQLGAGAAAPVVSENKTVIAGGAAVGGAVAGGVVAGGTVAAGGTTVVAGSTTVVAQPQLVSRAQRHWLVARTLHHCMFFSDAQPHIIRRAEMFPFAFPHGPFVAPPVGDLELISVGMVSDGLADKGPIYRVSLKNNSTIAARHFRVSLIATLGEINRMSPVVTMNIDELGAGAVGHIDVQLPHGVMTLGPQGQPGPFTTLIAAIDSFDELLETDELNNVATFTRGEIAVIETAVEAPAAAPAAVAPAAAGAPAAVAAPAPAAAGEAPATEAPAASAPMGAPAPQDGGDINKLDLDTVDGASELLSR
jgi:hypothetical protein